MFNKFRKCALAAGLALATLSGSASATYITSTVNFDNLGPSTGGGTPLVNHEGFTFDAGTYFFTALTNNYLITNNALTISRTDGSAFFLDSVDYTARGGESREFYFLINYADGSTFNGAAINASEFGNFRTAVGLIQSEIATDSRLIRSFTVVGKQTETADYTYLALDNFQFRVEEPVSTTPSVPEPASGALLVGGLGLIGWARRRRAVQSA